MDIKDFMPLIRIIALSIHRPLPFNTMLDDLVQNGMIGLITAFREHNADSAIPFKSFVCNKIQRAIMDELRAGDWAERAVRGRASRLARATENLQAQLQREPTMKEIADALGIRVDDVTTMLGDASGSALAGIDDHPNVGMRDNPAPGTDRRTSRSRTVAGLKTLQPNERRAFILRAMCDMSGREASIEMKLSESRVSQLYKAASGKLADYVTRPRHVAY
jgi:RNA polymerase sigma factor for flagellar operon FliA